MSDNRILFKISELAYALYKQDWIDTHTTPASRLESVREYYAYTQECVEANDEPDSYENYLEENGFHGFLYVCYDEFCGTEYMDEDYIAHLLNNNPILIKAYQADITARTADDENISPLQPETTNNELSLEILKNMVREPVWLDTPWESESGWRLCYGLSKDEPDVINFDDGTCFDTYQFENKSIKAYAHKPNP